jgi:hypothetical protein
MLAGVALGEMLSVKMNNSTLSQPTTSRATSTTKMLKSLEGALRKQVVATLFAIQ